MQQQAQNIYEFQIPWRSLGSGDMLLRLTGVFTLPVHDQVICLPTSFHSRGLHRICVRRKCVLIHTWHEYLGSVFLSTAWPKPGTTLPLLSVSQTKSLTSPLPGLAPSYSTALGVSGEDNLLTAANVAQRMQDKAVLSASHRI